MARTRVKICGVTCAEDAAVACAAGADAIGMVFHPPAKRAVSVETAAEIISAIPPYVNPVGLFLDTSAAQIITTAQTLGLRCVQLHGHEKPELVQELALFAVIKVVHVLPGKLCEALAPWRAAAPKLKNLVGIALETGWGAAKGGTGIENDWDQIADAQVAGEFEGLPPIIVAGGLRPDIVAQVIQRLRPYAVDVSSGVEKALGRKDRLLVERFMLSVRLADHESRKSQPSPL